MEYIIMNKSEHIKIARRYNPSRACYGLSLLQDLDFLCLTKDQKLLLFSLYAMAAHYENKLPLNIHLIQSVAGPDVAQADITLLASLEFIDLIDGNISFPAEDVKTQAIVPVATPGLTLVEPQVYPEWLNLDAWNEFLQHRRDIRKPASALAIKKLLKVLEANQSDHVQIIDNSIQGRWAGLFPLKGGRKDDNDWYKSTIDGAFGED